MVKYINRNEDMLRKQRMMEALMKNEQRNFWDESKRIHRTVKVVPPRIDEAESPQDIVNLFANKYEDLYNSVPSDPTVMDELRECINNDIMLENNSDICTVYPQEVAKAAGKLKAKKPDGEKGLWSNHIKFGPPELFGLVSQLMTTMFVHGTNASDILVATINSLTKDKHGDYCDSNNYRGTALISAIAKIYDLIIIDRYQVHLETSNLQFAFKSGHSTVMCHNILKETVNYYLNRGSDVYCVMLDASKAFDRPRYDKLFEIMRKRKFPPMIVRVLMDMYTRQKARTTWSNQYSEYFGVQNGIRQGGIISPLLYTIYADELVRRLKDEGLGCHVGNKYYGTPGYADDLSVICPSVKGLQRMVTICEEYGIEYDIKYNEKKSLCMVFSRHRQKQNISIYLNGAKLECVTQAKHLGMYISSNMKNEEELRHKRGNFIGCANHVLSKYAKMSSEVKCKMIQTYCCHFYGCETWNFRDTDFNRVLTSWNIAIRRAWKLPYDAHRYLLPALANHNPKDLIYSKYLALYHSMTVSKNEHVSYMAKMNRHDARSLSNINVQQISKDWKVNVDCILNGMHISKPSLTHDLNEMQMLNIQRIVEINHCVEGFNEIPGFTYEELQSIYDFIAAC